MDGYWIQQVRELLGPTIPVMSSLDLHANVSPKMIAATNAMVSYKKNPHVDMRETGKAAAQLLVDTLEGRLIPTQVLVQTPVSISIEQQFTSQEPCLSLYNYAHQLSQQEGVVSLSILLGFPYADVEEMGTSIIVVTNNDKNLALEVAKKLENYIIENHQLYVGEKFSIRQAIDEAKQREKPVLFLDMGDNVGGGSPGNNVCILESLVDDPSLSYFLCIYDPAAVQQALRLQIGETGDITFTGTNALGTTQMTLPLTLVHHSDGHFQEQSPRHGGQLNYYMGDTAVMKTANGSTIMFISLRVPPFSLQQLYANGVDPLAHDVLIAKGVIAPLAAYAPVTKSSIQVNTPGVTQADATQFIHQYRRKPLFPFEKQFN
jgi:microcystin degradation protein MlrC